MAGSAKLLPGMPGSFPAWAGFIVAVFVAGVVINTAIRRLGLTQLATISEGV